MVGVKVGVAAGVEVDVAVGVKMGVVVGIEVDVAVGVKVGVAVGVAVDVAVGVKVGATVGVEVDMGVGTGAGRSQPRFRPTASKAPRTTASDRTSGPRMIAARTLRRVSRIFSFT